MKAFLGVVFMAGLGLGMISSCDEADELVDCQNICSRYKTCLADDKFDVSDCRSKCEEKADKEQGFAEQADKCEACVDDRSCSNATWNCTNECAAIIIKSS